MASANNPYSKLSEKAFWRPSVAERHFYELSNISRPISLSLEDRYATAGSCFAQHIGRHLRLNGANYLDLEPKPDFVPPAQARRFGYDIYSCRYGNIYTVRQLVQLASEALEDRKPSDLVWERDGRYYDALRPSIDPVGFDTPDKVLRAREVHLAAVKSMFCSLDVFVFTMGLTEAWVLSEGGTVFPTAPGTIAGHYDPDKYRFHNFRYPEIMADLRKFWELLLSVNPSAKMLLTVSPVPLAATASDDHVMVATARSKATLRAVAGDLAEDEEKIFYFPSYEIVSSHANRSMFYEPDLRNVNNAGVEFVMKHFFGAFGEDYSSEAYGDEPICDEALLDEFAS